ncbi:MAG: hypothetical protein NTNFB01_26430 [Nitrospira sp.]|jgi:hypothetical protein
MLDSLKLIIIIGTFFGTSFVGSGSKQMGRPTSPIISGPGVTTKWQLTVIHVVTEPRRHFERKAQTDFD